MRIPVTRLGLPQVAVYPVGIGLVMAGIGLLPRTWLPQGALVVLEAALAIVLIWVLSFFRDPDRACPQDPCVLLAPADGTITDIEIVQEAEYIRGPALKIGIFLSIFSVHINRSTCRARIEQIRYKPGMFMNAMNNRSSQVNESNSLFMVRLDAPEDRLIIRQVSGAIARRIVCPVSTGKTLLPGERFGMIKFGSRTELYIQAHKDLSCQVRVGDKVRAGLTVVARYQNGQV